MSLISSIVKLYNRLSQNSIGEVEDGITSCDRIKALCRQAVAEGCVLLKNDGTLPLDGKRFALFGRCQCNTFYVGYGSGGDVVDRHAARQAALVVLALLVVADLLAGDDLAHVHAGLLGQLHGLLARQLVARVVEREEQHAMAVGAAFSARMCAKEGAFGYGTPITGRTEL